MKKQQTSFIALIFVAICWGFGYIACEFAYKASWGVFPVLLIRGLLGFLVCFLITAKRKIWKNKKLIIDSCISGIIFSIAYVFQLYGQKYTTVSNTSLITMCGIIMIPVFAWLWFKKKPSIEAIIACFIGLLSSIVLSINGTSDLAIGDMLCMVGAILYALYYVWIDHISNRYDALDITTIQFVPLTIISLVGMFIIQDFSFGDVSGLWGVLYFALISGVLCFFLQTWSQKYVEPSKAGLILSFEGIAGAIMSILIFKEKITINIIIGTLLMILAIIITQNKMIKKLIYKNKKEVEHNE